MIFYGTLIGILIYIAVQLHHIKMLLKKIILSRIIKNYKRCFDDKIFEGVLKIITNFIPKSYRIGIFSIFS